MSATSALAAAPVAAKAASLSQRKALASGKPYAARVATAAPRRSLAARAAGTSTPELDINTKIFEKELVDVAGEGEYIVRGGRHLFEKLPEALAGIETIGVEIDDRDIRGGEKTWSWVKKGIPIRLEVGPRDMESGSVFMARRDKSPKDKETVPRDRFLADVCSILDDMQQGMFHSLGVQSLALNTRTRELQNVFYGTAVSYDFALGTSDALLAAALYRNLFGLEGRAVHVNKMTAYVRKQLQMLDQLESEVFLSGQWKFSKVD